MPLGDVHFQFVQNCVRLLYTSVGALVSQHHPDLPNLQISNQQEHEELVLFEKIALQISYLFHAHTCELVNM